MMAQKTGKLPCSFQGSNRGSKVVKGLGRFSKVLEGSKRLSLTRFVVGG